MEPLKESVVTGIVNRVRERMKHGSEYNLTALIEFEIPKMYKADRRERYFKEIQSRFAKRSAEARHERAVNPKLAEESAREAERRYP